MLFDILWLFADLGTSFLALCGCHDRATKPHGQVVVTFWTSFSIRLSDRGIGMWLDMLTVNLPLTTTVSQQGFVLKGRAHTGS